jgi:hypothetical protein
VSQGLTDILFIRLWLVEQRWVAAGRRHFWSGAGNLRVNAGIIDALRPQTPFSPGDQARERNSPVSDFSQN